MIWNDIAAPRFFTLLLGALSLRRPALARLEARRGRWQAELRDDDAIDFEDTRPCRWLLTEPPPLDALDARESPHNTDARR